MLTSIPVFATVQLLPSPCRAAPDCPTTQMSVAELAQMPVRNAVVPLADGDQALPFQ